MDRNCIILKWVLERELSHHFSFLCSFWGSKAFLQFGYFLSSFVRLNTLTSVLKLRFIYFDLWYVWFSFVMYMYFPWLEFSRRRVEGVWCQRRQTKPHFVPVAYVWLPGEVVLFCTYCLQREPRQVPSLWIRISRFCTMEFLPKWGVREVWDCIAASHFLSPFPHRVRSNLETAVRLCTLWGRQKALKVESVQPPRQRGSSLLIDTKEEDLYKCSAGNIDVELCLIGSGQKRPLVRTGF